MSIWCERALVDGTFEPGVRVATGADGRIAGLAVATEPHDGDLRLGLVVPGFANAHSHLFHRALRGRTHADGGDFWTWRQAMYAVARALDPATYRQLAVAVFTEMLSCGYTAVGEFHYVHHRPDGRPYDDHAMELALADAADQTGIRLTLLDTCYLTGGLGSGGTALPLAPEQLRFGDGTVAAWLARWHLLRAALEARPGNRVTLGAAIHSVRAVPADAIAAILAGLPADTPLHLHLSEQPVENADCLAAHGVTPTGLLARVGALSERLTAVHATHLSADDVRLLGAAHASIALCPTTEADLGDGIGPGRALHDAGARLCIGSDQNAVVDPLLELRGLEAGERLASGTRGVFDPGELWTVGSAHGYHALGLAPARAVAGLAAGDWCDLVELDTASMRTTGSRPAQLALTATAADVLTTVVGGHVTVNPEPAALLTRALRALEVESA